MKEQPVKPWFLLRGKEYSTDFNFFMEHQVLVSNSQTDHTYGSRLESYRFQHDNRTSTNNPSGKDLTRILQGIHINLLKGKYGAGKYID